mmetsp:Transcript_32021/g.72899  ORF Transcript_32021/g.72899 Transcript_32021/m.72899 type:complete len:213 (-) Transcript_32021:380-1018(-)
MQWAVDCGYHARHSQAGGSWALVWERRRLLRLLGRGWQWHQVVLRLSCGELHLWYQRRLQREWQVLHTWGRSMRKFREVAVEVRSGVLQGNEGADQAIGDTWDLGVLVVLLRLPVGEVSISGDCFARVHGGNVLGERRFGLIGPGGQQHSEWKGLRGREERSYPKQRQIWEDGQLQLRADKRKCKCSWWWRCANGLCLLFSEKHWVSAGITS